MSSDDELQQGQKLWVMEPEGGARPAIYVGEGENATFFGGPPLVYIVFTDTRQGAEVEVSRITLRDDA